MALVSGFWKIPGTAPGCVNKLNYQASAAADTAKMATWSQFISCDTNTGWKMGAVISIIIGGCAAVSIYRWTNQPNNLPPGPTGMPFVGVIPFLSNEPHEDFIHYSTKYKSDVVSFFKGTRLTVVLNSERVIREAFSKIEFSGRPSDAAEMFQTSDLLFSVPYSETLDKNKKFMMQSLRAFGFGTPQSEQKITKQLKSLKEIIDASENKPWTKTEFDKYILKVTSNVILDILFGCTYTFDDPELSELIKAVREVQSVFLEDMERVTLYLSVFPTWFVKLIFCWKIQRAGKRTQKLYDILGQQLVDHIVRQNDSSTPSDFLDAALQEFKNQEEITTEHIIHSLALFLPGSIDGIASQIQWCIYYLVSFPNNQSRMVDEIKTVCGSRAPLLQDTTKLPFCECVILEAMRSSSMFALSSVHVTTEDVTLEGYNIPADTTVLGNIYAVHHNPETFSLPGEFYPERFLKESGSITRSTNVIPFSTGRRSCIGESLVKSEVFLVVTHLIFHYHITSHNPGPPKKIKGTFRRAPEHEFVFTKRM